MQSVLEYYDSLPEGLDETMVSISKWLRHLPNRPGSTAEEKRWSLPWSSHALTRAVKQAHGLTEWEVCDGFFARKGQQHSWLTLQPSMRRVTLVLDILPVAAHGGPLLVDTMSHDSPWADLYLESPLSYYTLPEKFVFDRQAHLILQASACSINSIE